MTTGVLDADELYRLNVTLATDMLASSGMVAPPVPEPAGIVMYAAGLLGLGWNRLRRTPRPR